MESKKIFFTARLLLFSLLLAGMIIVSGEIIIRRDSEHEESLLYDSLLTTGALLAQDIQKNMASGIFVPETLYALLESNNFQTDDFNSWGTQIVTSSKTASTVQLAPEGIVSFIYPLEGNEKAMGHDLLSDQRRDNGALKTIESRELTYIGPVKLIQNGKYAVISRKPVFRTVDGEETFWGFTIALLLLEDIVPYDLHQLEEKGFYIRLTGEDPDAETAPVLFESKNYKKGSEQSITINVPNGRWVLTLGHPPVYNKYYNLIRLILYTAATTAAAYIFIQQYLMHHRGEVIARLNIKLQEQALQDELTGVGNRRSGMQTITNQVLQSGRYGQPVSFAMIDFDFFKHVNDNYGHPAGDSLLVHLAESLKKILRKSDTICRLGGDEFFIIFPQTRLSDCRKALENAVDYLNKTPLEWNDVKIPISLSIGIAEYKKGESENELLHRVDEQLYAAKAAGRGCISS